jgi:hypothetical protein
MGKKYENIDRGLPILYAVESYIRDLWLKLAAAAMLHAR